MAEAIRQVTLGVLLFPGFEPLDVIGPVELFACAAEVSIVFISERPGSIPASKGSVQLIASTSFDDILSEKQPVPDWLLVPGGVGTRMEVKNPSILQFVSAVGPKASLCMSVCTGTALLAASGILDGFKATSNKRAFDWVASNSDKVKWERQARWVHDGNFVTSSGVSAGMDMAVYVLKATLGEERASEIAAYVEYLPATDAAADPFADLSFKPKV
jgi:putative intracellular protease/amidase